MIDPNKPVKFTFHALESIRKRGSNEDEVIQTIRDSVWDPARYQRFECLKNFPYNDFWNGKFYKTKQVRPIFIDDSENLLVITIYVFYF